MSTGVLEVCWRCVGGVLDHSTAAPEKVEKLPRVLVFVYDARTRADAHTGADGRADARARAVARAVVDILSRAGNRVSE